MSTCIFFKLLGVNKWNKGDVIDSLRGQFGLIHKKHHQENDWLPGFDYFNISKSKKTIIISIPTHWDYGHVQHAPITISDFFVAISQCSRVLSNLANIKIIRAD